MSLASLFIEWIRAGYPTGVPHQDFVPLLALLERRLTEEEAVEVARELRELPGLAEPRIDAGVGITRVTDELPSDADIARVLARLEAGGAGPDWVS